MADNEERSYQTSPPDRPRNEAPAASAWMNDTTVTPAEPRDERALSANATKARVRHIRRFQTQFAAWGTILCLATVGYPMQYSLMADYAAKCINVSVARQAACVLHPYATFEVVFISILAVTLLYHIVRRGRARDKWEIALNQAKNMVQPRITAKGYTGLFNIYVRTKRRSYILLGWSLLAILYATIEAVVYVKLGMGAAIISVPLLSIGLVSKLALGLLLLQRAYSIGCSFMPGEVLVTHTLTLATLGAFDVTPEEASREVEEATAIFEEAHPWWFHGGTGGAKIVSISIASSIILITTLLAASWVPLVSP
jgi:hypothetical protein